MTINNPTVELPSVYFGIDVSKAVLDICLVRDSGKPVFNQFPNNSVGHAKMLTWSQKQSAHAKRFFCLEATGSYSLAIAEYLHKSSEYTSVVNPAHIKYSGAEGAANKTDKAAALKIANFARLHHPDAWVPPTPEMRRLTPLVRYVDDLITQRAAIRTKLKDPALIEDVRTSNVEIHDTLSQQIDKIQTQIDQHLNDHPNLRKGTDLLETISGVGELTAQRLLAEMPDPAQCRSAQSAAAYAGLSPREHRSGSSVRRPTTISKAGNKHLRSCLYLPAISALQHNPRIMQLADRMRANGKTKMQIIVAAMRKLVMIAYGILKSGKPFTTEIQKPVLKSPLQTLTT